MKSNISKILVILIVCLLPASCKKGNPVIEVQTPKGNIQVELYVDKAPVTAGNFLTLVKKGVFDGGSFYRTVRSGNDKNPVSINVIQGGIQEKDSISGIKPIPHETTDQTGIKHKDGVISMARTKPGTATTEFFICIGDEPELDIRGLRNPDGQGFAAFGQVVAGMDVVGAIWRGSAEGQKLSPSVRIHKIIIR